MKVLVGAGSCGFAAGAHKVMDELESIQDIQFTYEITGCIGMCHLEPILEVHEGGEVHRFVAVMPQDVRPILENYKAHQANRIGTEDAEALMKQPRIVLKNCGVINPESIDDYIAIGGYEAIQACYRSGSQEQLIDEIKKSGLRGRGGAGFPTWFKWDAAKKSPGAKKYVVCNADEGDPGAFMDRSVLEGDPHTLIEGMMICGFAIGSDEGVVYVRAEYPLAIRRLEKAIIDAKARGFLGQNVFGIEGRHFELRIKAGAGAFVCGEETALIASLEGERGMPRLKPPFPAQKGFWQLPTNINNVETFANVPWIVRNGGAAFAEFGCATSKGTKVFALTGKVKKGGLVEVPMGISLREVIYDIGGGIVGDRPFKAVQLGGPSGGCIPESLIDTTVDYESITKTGAIVGSGGMVVMDDTTCMVDMARFFLDFTCKESCGKCTYCRLGTKRMLEILERITIGEGKEGDIALLEELSYKIKDGSLCGLGQTAPNPVLTTIKYFRNEYEDHILHKKCTAKQCSALIQYLIDPDKCIGCTLCAKACPVSCISGERKAAHLIDQSACIKCGQCYQKCKFDAISVN